MHIILLDTSNKCHGWEPKRNIVTSSNVVYGVDITPNIIPSMYSKLFHLFDWHVMIYQVDITLVNFLALWLNSALQLWPSGQNFWPSSFYLFGHQDLALWTPLPVVRLFQSNSLVFVFPLYFFVQLWFATFNSSCQKFITCYFSKDIRELGCQQGQIFDYTIEKCVLPEEGPDDW